VSALTFTLKKQPQQRVDLSALTPQRLEGKSVTDIAAVQLLSGNRRIAVADLFQVRGGDYDDIVIRNSCARLDRIGQGNVAGRIRVFGDAGAYLGFAMRGGELTLSGNAGAYAASHLLGGSLRIEGDAGDFLGAALPGEHQGMRGGMVIVGGNAGDRVGDHMRRGVVLIHGNAGAYCGSRMGAGTIAVLGGLGVLPGYAMRRGTLLFKNAPSHLPVTFNDCGEQHLAVLNLLLRAWAGVDPAFVKAWPAGAPVRRLVGDLAGGGKGEILLYVH
jgi:formylmethanofuran dehydrogenase subunit C